MKLLVDEAQSDQMRQISSTVDAIGVCRISWAETMAALARLQREDPISNEDLEQTVLFACYDRRLNQAAQLLKLEVLP